MIPVSYTHLITVGHEMVGIVESVGAKVTHVKPGDRVTAVSYTHLKTFDILRQENIWRLEQDLNGSYFYGIN